MQRFTDKIWLTKLVDRKGWAIYRDSQHGLYADNDELGLDVNLMYWNATKNSAKLDWIVDDIRDTIDEAEAEYHELFNR